MTTKRMTKTGLDYFPIDVDLLLDPKLRALQAKHGNRGVGILIRLLCNLYRNGYCLPWDAESIEGFSWDARETVDEVRSVVETLLSSGFFDRCLAEGGTPVLTSAGIQKRYLNVTSRRLNRSIPVHLDLLLGGRTEMTEGELATFLQHDVDTMQTRCKHDVDIERTDKSQTTASCDHDVSRLHTFKGQLSAFSDKMPRKSPKGKERKVKESKEKERKEDLPVFPSSLDTAEHRAAFSEWLDYKRQRRETLLPVSQEKLLTRWASKPDQFVQAVQVSIASGWQGIFEDRESGKSATASIVGVSAREQRMLSLSKSYSSDEDQAIEVEAGS